MQRIYKPELRLQATDDGPLRGGDGYQFGFYDSGVMRQILDNYGGEYKIWTLPIPVNNYEYSKAVKYVSNPKVQYALVDKDKIVFCVIENSPGWMSALNELGYEVFSGDKTNKRLKSHHRPTLLNAEFGPDELKLMLVAHDEFSRYIFLGPNPNAPEEYCNPGVAERLLDGGFVISRRIVQRAVENLPMYHPTSSIDAAEYYYDPRIRSRIVNNLLNAHVLNARIEFEMGFLKGNCIVSDNLPEGVDILTSDANIKQEIKYNNGFRFLAEPQGPKEKVITDDQTVINFPKLFRKSDMDMWLTEEYKKQYEKAINGELLTNWQYIYQRNWRDNESLDDNEARARTQYVGYRWTAAGFNITQSPWLMETVSISHAKPLEYRIPIPCSVYEQVIPESFIRMAGYDFQVEPGQIRRHSEVGVHVVNDLDWLEMYESHGGHDEDDFFKLFYREFEGGPIEGKKVVAVRSPNGFGEYSIFDYVEGEWSPTWLKSDGTEVKFPKVNGRGWPKRLSEATLSSEVHYKGLPSLTQPKEKREGPYTQEDVLRDIRIAMAGGNVGSFVNACMMHSSVIGKHRPLQLCSLEDAIDKCINPDHELDVKAIDQEAQNMFREVIEYGKPIDRNLWYNRGSQRYLKQGEEIELYDGKITQLNNLCYTHFNNYCNDIRMWSQENAQPPEIIHELGRRFYTWALPILRDFRKGVYNTNSSEVTAASGAIERTNWEHLYQQLVNKIESFERIEDMYDFVIALYSATILTPTTQGKISDQVVMNRFVFPYLEHALQFYGIAARAVYNQEKKKFNQTYSCSWQWTNADGELVEYNDPVEFQMAHSNDSPIDFRMPAPTS